MQTQIRRRREKGNGTSEGEQGTRKFGNTFRTQDVRPEKTQIIFRCKGGQILPVVVTNRHVVHVNFSS